VRNPEFMASRAVAGKLGHAFGMASTVALLAGAFPSEAVARDNFFYNTRSYVPRGYYQPYNDYYRPRSDDGYTDPLAKRTAEQLKRSPAPPATKGPLLISVSLATQSLTLYDDGVAIAHSPISSGNAQYPTPTGVFSVIQKQRFHRSNLYSDAPMPFMQRITWSGVALHSGQLQGYPASHGCIRLPSDFAVRLWRTTSTGARVVITQRDLAPVEISHARLFTLPEPGSVPVAQKPTVQPAVAVEPAKPAVVSASADTPQTQGDAPAKAETKLASANSGMTPPELGAGAAQPEKQLRPGPVSVFISRKEQRLYVRKGFEPVFDTPVVIANADQALGTHLFVAMSPKAGATAVRWMVVSPPARESGKVEARHDVRRGQRHHAASAPAVQQSPATAAAALDRIEIPAEAAQRITELMTVGAALTISDEGLGPETGKETDFTVVTSPIQPTKRPRSYERDDYWPRYNRRWF